MLFDITVLLDGEAAGFCNINIRQTRLASTMLQNLTMARGTPNAGSNAALGKIPKTEVKPVAESSFLSIRRVAKKMHTDPCCC